MALFAKSERFPVESCNSDLGPGDYNPPSPKPNAAGAVSLGFTAPKGLPNSIREQAIEEDTNLSPRTSAVRLRRTSVAAPATRRPSMGRPRFAANAAAARVEKIEVEQLAKRLTWSEREREKLQNEVLKFRQREEALIKSEKHALAESVRAAEHRASIAAVDAERLKAAEAEVERLTLDAESERKTAAEAAAGCTRLQTDNDSLTSRVVGLEERVKGFIEKEVELSAAVAAAEVREEELERRRVKEMEEVKASFEEELKEARASVNRSIVIAEEASRRAETVGAELTATKFGARPLEALASRLWSDLEACKGSLSASEDGKKALIERMNMLDAEWEERARMLETELEVSKAAPEENDVTVVEVDMRAIESDQKGIRARLERAEVEAAASIADKSRLEKDLAGEKAIRGKLEHEVASAREALRDAARRGASLEVNLAESESKSWRLKGELDEARSQLASSEELRKKLEATISAKAHSITELQQRLGDALAEGVEYADQAIVSEERLRGSEAEYTALWREREEAKEQLRVALLEGRELASKMDKSAAETVRLREALQKAEFRLTSAMGDAEELEEELAASRDQCALSKKELEKARDKHADACSEARLLKASCEEGRAEITRLREELARAESRRGQADARREGFWANLALSKRQKDFTKKELTDKDAQVQGDTGAGDDAVLEVKLREADLSADRLRSTLESTEMTMSEVQADAQRSRFDLEDALRKCTDFQERLSEADDRLKSEASDRRHAEEALSHSAARVTELEQALREAEPQRISAAASNEELDARLKEMAGENGRLRDTLSKALIDRDTAADRIARLEAGVEECSSLRKTGIAVVKRAVRSAATLKALEARLDELTCEAEILRCAVAAKDAELDQARARLEETAGRLEDTTGRLEEMTSRLQETTAHLRAANAFAEEQKSTTLEYEVEGARLMELLDDIEADFAEGKETTEDLKQDLADVRGIGMQLAKRLASLVVEKSEIERRFDIAEAALTASEAQRSQRERELEIRDVVKEGLAGEAKELRKECERLKEAGQSQAEGAQALLAESEAQYQETIARLQLAEIKPAQEIALAKKEAQRAKHEAETISAEVKEVRARNDSLSRTLAEEQSRAVREAGLANQKDENVRLLDETAALSAELALATAVLEVVGILPKEDSATIAESAAAASIHAASKQSEERDSPEVTGIGRGLFARALSGVNSRSSSRESDGVKPSKTATPAANPGTTTESRTPCVPLKERLLRAIDSTEPSRRKGARKAPQRQLSGASTGTGCFPSISCAAADFCEDISAGKPDSPSSQCYYLADDRVRDEVRRMLQAKGARSVGK